jgi:hypothetical protein
MKKLVLVALWFIVTLALAASQHAKPAGVASTASNTVDARGTPSQPLAVSVIPAPKSAEDLEKEGYERGEKRNLDRGMTAYTGYVAVLTVGLLVVAAAQALMFYYQLRIMAKSLGDTKVAADAAKESAKSARESTDIARVSMIASERAYVHHGDMRWTSHLNITSQTIYWRLQAGWNNSGNTPTRGLRLWTEWLLQDKELPEDHVFDIPSNAKFVPAMLAPGANTIGRRFNISGEDLAAVAAGTKHLYLWGRATYKSVFPESGEHVTDFCRKATNITGNPKLAWDKTTNNVGIEFMAIGWQNCSDEDCEKLRRERDQRVATNKTARPSAP